MQTKPDYFPSYPVPAKHPSRSSRPYHQPVIESLLRPPAGFVGALGDGICWIAAAILLRVLAEGMVLSSASLWSVTLATVLAPALVAIWLSAIAPRLSLVLGYRLILLMLGLLLGGRL